MRHGPPGNGVRVRDLRGSSRPCHLAKGLANGLPIGALLIAEHAARGLHPGDHGTTFGGSPVPCAAALAHLRVRDELNLNAHVLRVGAILLRELESLAAEFPTVFGAASGRRPHAGITCSGTVCDKTDRRDRASHEPSTDQRRRRQYAALRSPARDQRRRSPGINPAPSRRDPRHACTEREEPASAQ